MAAGASRPVTTARRLAVAASGGLDSVALLHCVSRQAAVLGIEVHALHVHHGLHPDASAWQAQLTRQCRRWSAAGLPVSLHVRRIDQRPGRGESIEAWARRVRYQALAEMAREAGCHHVLLAHHRRDQAETVLLQALRGAGPAGLAAMPRQVERGGICWLRPWLDQPRKRIESYGARWRLAHVQDPTNADLRYARSRLRQVVLPALTQSFPEAEASLCALARRAHEGAAALSELAESDQRDCLRDGALQLAAWMGLSAARRANVLRHWAAQVLPDPVPESLVQRLMTELLGPHAEAARWPAGSMQLWLHQGALHAAPSPPVSPVAVQRVDLSRPGRFRFDAWSGCLVVEHTDGPGVPARLLCLAELRPRRGGERFQLAPRATPRSLKKQYQACGLARWQRHGPLVFAQEQLVFVPGLGLDARCVEPAGPGRLKLRWLP